MNSAEFTGRTNLGFFFGTVALALAMVVGSGVLLNYLLGKSSAGLEGSTKACQSVLKSSGLNPRIDKATGAIVVQRIGDQDLELLVNKSGVMIASCPTHSVKDYCAGLGCPQPGMSFTLVPKN